MRSQTLRMQIRCILQQFPSLGTHCPDSHLYRGLAKLEIIAKESKKRQLFCVAGPLDVPRDVPSGGFGP